MCGKKADPSQFGELPDDVRPIPEWPGYQVDTSGNVWSNKKYSGKWLRLRVKIDQKGYRAVTLRNGDAEWTVRIGRLVLMAHKGVSPLMVRHLNDIKTDDRLINLEYGTAVDNAEDARRNGKLCIGESHGNAKLNDIIVRQIRALRAEGKTLSEISNITGQKKSLVSHVCTGRLWRHVK